MVGHISIVVTFFTVQFSVAIDINRHGTLRILLSKLGNISKPIPYENYVHTQGTYVPCNNVIYYSILINIPFNET